MTDIDDDEVRALENRLRQNGWTEKLSDQRLTTRKPRRVAPPPVPFGGIDAQIRTASQQLADDFNGYSWPLYGDVAAAFGFSFDDAVRTLSEAKRLAGVDQ